MTVFQLPGKCCCSKLLSSMSSHPEYNHPTRAHPKSENDSIYYLALAADLTYTQIRLSEARKGGLQ